jgi:hypothetical protein
MKNTRVRLLAVLTTGQPVYSISGAEGDEGGEDDESEKDKDGKPVPKGKSKNNPETARLVQEATVRRLENKALTKKIEELEEATRQAGLKDASELEKMKSDLAKLQAADAKKTAALQTKARENAAIIASRKLKLDWADDEDVLLYLAKADGVEVDDDGTVTGIEEALKKLSKAKPHWLKKAEEDKPKGPPGASGGNVGGSGNGRGNGTDRSAMEAKYPGLSTGRRR